MQSERQQLRQPQPVEPPSLRALLTANLKVGGVVILVMLVAWLVWWGLAALFPQTEWLQLAS